MLQRIMERLHRKYIADLSLEIAYDSVYSNDGETEANRSTDEQDRYEYALLRDYRKGNFLILN